MEDIAAPDDFFYPKYCILCLETNSPDYIHIYSDDGRQLGIERIIVKHFWVEPNETSLKKRFICRECWDSLYSFHKFYLRVESVHNILEEGIPVLYCESTIEDPIGENSDISIEKCAVDSGIVTRKRRGRPKAQKNVDEILSECVKKVSKSDNEHLEKELSILKSEMSPISTRRSGRTRKQVRVPSEISARKEKQRDDGVLGEKSIKTEFDTNTTDTTIDEDHNNELKQNKKGRKLTQSIQYDKYIAEHFNLTCSVCNIKVPKFNILIKHHLSEHQQRGYAVCCDKKFYRRFLLVDHIQSHTNPQHYRCPHCNKEWNTRHNYELHLKRHEEKLERKYQCEICSKRFYKKSNYTRHMLTHVPEEEKHVKCTQCEKTFHTQNLMEQHYGLAHLRLYAKICDVCGKFIHGKKAFQHHMEEHLGIAQPIYQCETCGIKHTDKYQLNKHVKDMHSVESQMPKTCDICGKISPGLPAHRTHVYYAHTLKRIHACTFCDKTFKQPTKLREHMTTHTGDVLYTCTYCPRTFNSNANMYAHRKRTHRKEWEENRLQKYSMIKEPAKNEELLSQF